MVRLLSVLTTILLLAACGSAPTEPASPLGLVSVSPQGAGIPVESVVTAVFDSALAGALQQGIIVTSGGKIVAGSLSYDAETFSLTFTPNDQLAYGATYNVELSDRLMNEAGLGLAAKHGWSFSTEAVPANPTNPTNPNTPSNPTNPTDPTGPTGPTSPTNPSIPTTPTRPDADGDGIPDDEDNAPHHYNPGQEDSDGDGIPDVLDPDSPLSQAAPTVVAMTPAAGQIGVAVDWVVSAQFSRPMDEASITETSFSLAVNGIALAGYVDYDAETNTAYFGPAAPLAFETRYTVTLSSTIRSEAGLNLEQSVSWDFTTVTEAQHNQPVDPTRLRVLSRSISNGVVILEFNKPMNEATLTANAFRVKRAKGGWLKGTVSYREYLDDAGNWHYVARFTANANLAAGKSYRVMLKSDVAAADGQALGSTYHWFLVADN